MSKFFINRPIFAIVIAIVITMVGILAMVNLPIARYPQISPPTVRVSAHYTGATAQVVNDTVAFADYLKQKLQHFLCTVF